MLLAGRTGILVGARSSTTTLRKTPRNTRDLDLAFALKQDVFRAMHPDPDIVQLYLKPLLIGELAPEEPKQERNKNVSEVSGLKIRLVEDFQELRKTLETMNLFNANLGFFFLHLAQVLILEALALGICAKWWNIRDTQHHVKTNIYSKDPDIDQSPFLVIGDLQPVKYGKNKIKFINYEKQHLYFRMAPLATSQASCSRCPSGATVSVTGWLWDEPLEPTASDADPN
uniref:Uncharacterized protein n=1 Tax=Rangifer tarandus platyrhynchus TaxID=3082113 RepID=A0ACB0DVV3_RANTA|nr:unnamed protein product [Rangifer tarandus platyrhynchus]